MSRVNFLWMEISQAQPVTAVSRLAASHHWSASGSWHRTWWNILLLQRSLRQTLWTLNWLLILLTARTTQKTVDLTSGSRMPINTHCWLQLPRTCCQLLHLRHVVERVFSVCGELTAGKRNRLTKSLEKRIMLKMNLKYYAWFSMIIFSRILVNISGSSAR